MLHFRAAYGGKCTQKAKPVLLFGSMPRSNRSLTYTPKYASQAETYFLVYQ